MKLRTAVFLRVVAAAALPVIAVGFFLLTYVTRQVEQNVKTENELVVQSLVGDIRGTLNEPLTILKQVAVTHRSGKDEYKDLINEILARSVDDSDVFESIFVLEENGIVHHCGLRGDLESMRRTYQGMDMSRRSYVREAVRTQQPIWSEAHRSPVTGRRSVTLAVPAGKTAVVGNLSIEKLHRLVHPERYYHGHVMIPYLLDRDGALIFHPDHERAEQGTNMSNLLPVKNALAGEYGTFECTLEGDPYLCSVYVIAETGWVVMVAEPKTETFKLVRQIRVLFAAGIFLSVVIAAGVAFALSGKLARPLSQLGEAAQAVAAGEYKTVPQEQTLFEANVLARGFHEMAGKIQAREELLRESKATIEQQLSFQQTLIDAANVPIYYIDRDGRFQGCNSAFEETTGHTKDELWGKLADAVVSDSSLERHKEVDQRLLLEGGAEVYEVETNFADGQPHRVVFHKSAYRDADGKIAGIVGACFDITRQHEHNRALEALMATSANLYGREFFDGIASGVSEWLNAYCVGINLYHPETQTMHAQSLYSTGRLGDSFSYGLPGTPCEKVMESGYCVYPENVAELFPEDKDLVTLKVSGYAGVRLEDEKGSPVGVMSVLTQDPLVLPPRAEDILRIMAARISTEVIRGRYDEQRLEVENRLQSFFDTVGSLILVLDETGVITEANPRVAEALGLGRNEIVGRSFGGHLLPEDHRATFEKVESAVREGMPAQNLELPVIGKDGDEHVLLINVSRMGGEESAGVIVSAQDVTALREMQAELRQSEKLRGIGQLAGGVAHDFNNQLTGILNSAELLATKLKHDAELAGLVEVIKQAGENSAALTQQLLAFARRGAYRSEVINLNKTVSQVVDLLRHSIDRQIHITTRLPDGRLCTRGDPSQIQNAILNLGVNARDAMHGTGEITFAVKESRLSDEDCVRLGSAFCPGDYVLVTVTDTGKGMPPAVLEKAFEPFFTTKPEGEGTGMGLAAVHGTVREHGGAIHIDSEVGKGTAVSVYLPRCHSEETSVQEEVVVSTMGTPLKVLLVDDEPLVRKSGCALLREIGYETENCEDGQKAVAYFREHHSEIGLIILDMIMPKMNGSKAFSELRKIDSKVRVLIASGYTQTEDVREILSEARTGFVSKPFRLAELSQRVAQLLDAD